MKLAKHALIAAAALCALQAHADTQVFADTFGANALGLNAVPNGWAVTDGTVDIIGANAFNSLYDVMPGSGRYIDLDGSTGDAGVLSRSFAVTNKQRYWVAFELAGNHRNSDVESVAVNFGSAAHAFSLGQNAGWTVFGMSFVAHSTGMASLSFSNAGGDDVGMLLRTVHVVTAVPEPETYPLLLAGLAAVAFISRRRAV